MTRSITMSPALGWAYGDTIQSISRAKRKHPAQIDLYEDMAAEVFRAQRLYTIEPVVPERLRTKSELRPYQYTAIGYIRSWWGWQGARVTIFIGEFNELSAAFHQIKNMRVQRIEQANGAGHAVSREVKL